VVKVEWSYVQPTTSWRYTTYVQPMGLRVGPVAQSIYWLSYGLDGPGWGQDFPPVQTGPGAHPASCTRGTRSFSGVKCGRGVLLTTHPLLAPRSWKSKAIPLPPLGHNWACNGVTLPLPMGLRDSSSLAADRGQKSASFPCCFRPMEKGP
jgi:hypothetical protein